MTTELTEAKKEYTNVVSRRAKAMRIRQQANTRVNELELEAAELEKEIEHLKARSDELINECAINPALEKKLDANDKEIKRAFDLLDRKKKMIAAARKAVLTEIPSIEEGQQLLIKLGEAAAKDIVFKHQKDIDLAKMILAEAFACWSVISWWDEGSWEKFIGSILAIPSEEAISKASDKFAAEVVAPIEEAAQKECEA